MVGSRDDTSNRSGEGDGMASAVASPWEVLPRLRDLMQHFPFAICDVSLLPLPKPDMKIALQLAWDLAASDLQRAAIETGFLSLSQFQPGVGDRPIGGDFPPTADPAETATLVSVWMPWAERCEIEKWALWVELVQFKQKRLAKPAAQAA